MMTPCRPMSLLLSHRWRICVQRKVRDGWGRGGGVQKRNLIAYRMAAHYLGENSRHSAAANPAAFQTAKCHEPVLCRGGCARTSTPTAGAHFLALLQNAEAPALLRGKRWAAQPACEHLLPGYASGGTRCSRRRCFDPQHTHHAASRRTRAAPAGSDYETTSIW
jgi:hypothetical protein